MRQLFHLFSLRVVRSLFKSTYYDLIDSLDLAILLWISWGGIPIRNAQVIIIPLEGFAIKLKTIVQDKGTRDLKLSDNVFPNKLLGVHIFDIRQGLSFNPLGKIARADQQISLVPYCFGERANNIQAPLSKWLGD